MWALAVSSEYKKSKSDKKRLKECFEKAFVFVLVAFE